MTNVSNSVPYLYERLVNYSKNQQAEIEPIIDKWTSCPFFVECFQYDFHFCGHNFKNFKIAADWSEEYSEYYKSNCRKYPNALQWYFTLYKEWTWNLQFSFYDWIKNKKKEIPMPLPSKKGFRWYNVDVLLQHVFRNIIEKYETDLNPQHMIHYAAFSNYFSTLWANSQLRRISPHTQCISCITQYLPFPDKIVAIMKRYLRLLSLGGLMHKLLHNMTTLPGTSLTITRFTKRNLVNYVTGGELLLVLDNDHYRFPQLCGRRYRIFKNI